MSCSYDPDTEVKIVDYDVEAKRLENDPVEIDLRAFEEGVHALAGMTARRQRTAIRTLSEEAFSLRDYRYSMTQPQRSRYVRSTALLTRANLDQEDRW